VQPNKEGNQAVVTKLNVAAGLGELMCGKYKAAARLFLTANIDHCDFPEVSDLKYFIILELIFVPTSVLFIDVVSRLWSWSRDWKIVVLVLGPMVLALFSLLSACSFNALSITLITQSNVLV